MSAEPLLTSDVIGLTKVAPFSRRGFMTASAAVTAGYTLAAGPVRADVITTDTNGLTAGDAKIKVADGEMPGYFARPVGANARPVVTDMEDNRVRRNAAWWRFKHLVTPTIR
jgi:carboxymethylenebutenolidase